MSDAVVVNGVEFPPHRTVRIGRDPACDILVDDEKVSRHHATVERDGDGWVLRDAGSTNGTFFDGARVTNLAIGASMTVRLGDPATGATLLLALRALPAARPEPTTQVPTISEQPAPPAAPPAPAATGLGKLSVVYEARAERVRIGRDDDNDIVLDDLRVSRHHAELVRRGSTTTLVDLGSHNGTFVNGQRIEQAPLSELDVVAVGNHILRFTGTTLEEYLDSGEAWLEASGLVSIVAGDTRVLDGVGFSLEPSSLLGVVGPSGAGKSTLLGALTGFRPANQGFVSYGGRDVYSSYEDLRRRMGYVPQEDILHPTLTVRRALEFAAELRFPPDVDAASRSARIDEVLAELGLAERASLRIEQLSGGQRKRTSIALELLTKPSLLFLDEPTSGLDPGNEAQVMELLRSLADGGRIIVVVTHSVASLDVCDRVLFLAPGGKTAYFGPPAAALAYFGRSNYDGYARVFRALDEERDRDWRGAFARDPEHDRYVTKTAALSEARRMRGDERPLPPPPQQSWLRQFWVLTRRYAAVIASDKRNLIILALQAPVFGLLDFLLFPTQTFNTKQGVAAALLVWLVVMGASWLGLSNSVREIVKELPVYRRERSVGLSISAYIASKVAVLGVITIVQTTLLSFLAMARQSLPPTDPIGVYSILGRPRPTGGSLIGSPRIELFVTFALAGLAAMGIGLLLSALLKTADRAMSLLPLLLVAQLVVSMPTIPQKGPLQIAGNVFSAKWASDAANSTISSNELRLPYYAISLAASTVLLGSEQARKLAQKPFRPEWEHTAKAWGKDAGAIGIIFIAGVAGAWFAMKRRDRSVVGGAARGA